MAFSAHLQIAGVLISYRATIGTKLDQLPVKTKQGKASMLLFDKLEQMSNLFDTFGVFEIGRLFIASVAPKYRKIGLARELYR